MPIERELFYKQFTLLALNGRISLFLGAGGSRDAGYPSWKELFTPLADELEINIDDVNDYYKLAQYYANNFGTAELRKRINESINKSNFHSTLINDLINIGFTNTWTTNFDNTIENAYLKREILINKVFSDYDLSNVDLNNRINIFKLNGDITNIENIVATQDDYEKYAETHKLLLTFFKRELISSTFLFIGYSFTDYVVLDCLSEIARYLDGSTNFHYAILKDRPNDKTFKYFVDDLERRYHVRVLLVRSYPTIPKIINELKRRIQAKRVFISGSFSEHSVNIENYSHTFSDALCTGLYKHDYRIVNGIGRRFGTHLIGYATKYLAEHGILSTEKYLIIKPFVGTGPKSKEKKKMLRRQVISQCGAAIFLFGEQDKNSLNSLSGVLEEFNIANDQNKIIIPIAYPGTKYKKIWYDVKNNITKYPYLEKEINFLQSTTPLNELINIIVHILNATSKTHH